MNIRKRSGSLAIFFCLVMAAMIMIFYVLLQAAQLRSHENDLNRAMAAQIQTSLAAYDQKWQQFGLFGFLGTSPDPEVFTASLPAALRTLKMNLLLQKPLSDVAILDQQIVRYMKGRVPAVYLDILTGRLSLYRQKTVAVPVVQPFFAPSSGIQKFNTTWTAPASVSNGLLTSIAPCIENMKPDEVKNTANGLFGGILNQLKDEAMLKLQEIYRQYASELLGIESNDSVSSLFKSLPDFFDPVALSRLAGHLDQILNFETAPLYEKCCLVEYILGQFRPLVQHMRQLTGITPIRTLDGRTFESLPTNRQVEVEKILTGLSRPNSARLLVRVMMTSLRSLIHLSAVLANPSKMAALRTTAATVTAAIAVLTGGMVMINPEIMVYLLAVGEAIRAGMNDYQKLLEGRPVEFWPGQDHLDWPLFYQDYLRLFLLVVPHSTLISRTSKLLSELLPGPCYTSIKVDVVFHGRTYQLGGGYQE